MVSIALKSPPLQTAVPEPSWDDLSTKDNYLPLFPGQRSLEQYELRSGDSFMAKSYKARQEEYKALDINATVLGTGAKVAGLGPLLRRIIKKKDSLSEWRSDVRSMHAHHDQCKRADAELQGDLGMLETQLFDTEQYRGVSPCLTVITYTNGYYGTASLFQASLSSETHNDEMATQLNLIAQMRQVPQPILRQMQLRMPGSRIELQQNGGKVRYSHKGHHGYPFLAEVNHQTQGRWKATPGGWTAALGLPHASDFFIATIPQMLAHLHLKYSYLTNIKSGPWVHFSEALLIEDPKRHRQKVVCRGVKLLGPPDGGRHNGNPVTVVILFPSESAWAREPIMWA